MSSTRGLCTSRCGAPNFVQWIFVLIFLIGLQLIVHVFIISPWKTRGKKLEMTRFPGDVIKRSSERIRATSELANFVVQENDQYSSVQPPELLKSSAQEEEENVSSMQPPLGHIRVNHTSSKFHQKDISETKGASNLTSTDTHERLTKAHQDRTNYLPLCPFYPEGLVGKISINMKVHSFQSMETRFKQLGQGGHYKPPDCQSRHKVAIVVPYRDREIHLKLFLNHMHPFLQRQQLEYRIYVVEQAGTIIFNKATLMNIAFTEAMKQDNFDCFVFHDVDLLPEDDRIVYSCPKQPRHLAAAVDKFGYKPFYSSLIGGAIQLRTEHFRLVNGFSNKFWGWCCEDDDLAKRIQASGLSVIRYPLDIARYKMIKHPRDKLNPVNPIGSQLIMKEATKRFKQDGLNNLTYESLKTEPKKLYTLVYVHINKPTSTITNYDYQTGYDY